MTIQYTFSARSTTLLTEEFESALNAGQLRPGDRLPSVRALAAQLGVSPSTVAAAFSELRRRGLIVTRNRGASWVNERPPLVGNMPPIVIPPGVTDLATGNPDPSVLPDIGPAIASAITRENMKLYGTDKSPDQLAERVYKEVRAASVASTPIGPQDVSQVVVSGALDGVERALMGMFSRPSRIGIEDPGYDTLIGLVRALGHEPVPIPIDRNGPVVEGVSCAIDSGLDALIVTSRAQNPTGSAVSKQRAVELGELLSQNPTVALIENDHLGNIAGAPLASLSGVTARWIHVHSFAKSLGPDLRVAVLLGDLKTIERIRGRQSLGPGWVSEILQNTVRALLDDPRTERILDGANEKYENRRQTLVQELQKVGIQADPGTGFNVWIPVSDETSVVTGLLSRGWAVAPGSRYRLAAEPGIRVTVSSMTAEQAEGFAKDLASSMAMTPGRTA